MGSNLIAEASFLSRLSSNDFRIEIQYNVEENSLSYGNTDLLSCVYVCRADESVKLLNELNVL